MPSREPRKVDVLWLVEHVARELDVACAVKAIALVEHGLRVEVRNLYQHIQSYLTEFDPAVIVHPYVYFVEGALATEDVFRRWPDAIHVNAAWEQIHYRAHYKIKAPADDIARKQVIHFAWGQFFKDYLTEFGVPNENVVVNGHPAYQLYQEPYKAYFDTRRSIAAKFGLDVDKTWVFVPENYRWAFAQKKLDFFVSLGGDRDELNELINFSIPSLRELLTASRAASLRDDVEVIFRPRPAINTAKMLDFFHREVGQDTGRIHFIKEGTVREWILASDHIVSSYSTSLLEASVAGKRAWMFEPIKIPDGLHCEWYDAAPRLRTVDDFCGMLDERMDVRVDRLAVWARDNLLPAGDPIRNIVDQLVRLRAQAVDGRAMGVLPRNPGDKKYFNKDSHEMDEFSAEAVEANSRRWAGQLYGYAATDDTAGSNEVKMINNKSMNRDDLLTPDAQQIVKDLNRLIETIYEHEIAPSSWVGTLPKRPIEREKASIWKRLLGEKVRGAYRTDAGEVKALTRGDEQRLDYQPLVGAADDLRYPWFLYWEIYWVLRYMRPLLKPGQRLLDAGGAASLFTCYMASQGYELHSVDLNEKLLAHGDDIARKMGWTTMHSYCMDMRKLDFPDDYFDHAFSICVFEHLDFDIKQSALREISRCLKPGAILSLTFDYRNPAPGVVGIGKDPSPRNALKDKEDIARSFLGTGLFEIADGTEFVDDGRSYLQHPTFNNGPYTFGAIFLRNIKPAE